MSPSETNLGPTVRTPRFWPAIWAVTFVAGLALWLLYAAQWDPPRAWRALLVNFVYFAPLTCGMMIWPAVVMLSHGNWSRPVNRCAFAAAGFGPVAIVALLALWYGHEHWARWANRTDLPQGRWFDTTFLFGRDLVALVVVWVLAWIFAARARRGRPTVLAGYLALAYCLAFTLLGMDLVMALDPRWYSTLFGGYYFISGMYGALAAWTLIALKWHHAEIEVRHDLGKLIVAFSLITTYLMFSQLLPIWYENLPAEARVLIPRQHTSDWRIVSAALLGTIYLGPLVLLLTRWAKRTRGFLAAVAILVLVGLWVERWWLVSPVYDLQIRLGAPEISITASFVAMLALSVLAYRRVVPQAPQEQLPQEAKAK